MTGLETALRNARAKNPAAFDAALKALEKDSKRRPSRFARALRARFGGDPKKVMSALGMDANLLGEIHNERSSQHYGRSRKICPARPRACDW